MLSILKQAGRCYNMLIDGLTRYKKGHLYRVNTPVDSLYYFFDYDERSYKENMQFQHFHTFYEIMIPLEESAGHLIDGKYYGIQLHDMVLLRPSLLHKTIYPKGTPSRRIIINFRFPIHIYGMEEIFSKIFSLFDARIPIYRFPEKEKNRLCQIFNDIFHLTDSTLECKNLLIHNKFLEFLSTLYEVQEYNCYEPVNSGMTLQDRIYDITAYIHKHSTECLSLELLSQKFFISPHYLSHSFKEVTGFTLINYIQMVRIRNAQLSLISTNDKIIDIALRCGFTSFSQFSRCFAKFCEMSPSEYRSAYTVYGLETYEHREEDME